MLGPELKIMNAYERMAGARLLLLLTLLLLPMAVFADGVGKAIFVIGDVTLISADGKSVPLKKGHILNPGDRIDTSSKGQVQIRMVDGAFIGIRPNSSFEVTNYQLDETNPENQKSEFNLLKGGFRAITGKIGKTNKKAYKVVTPVATIGIRGTDYVAMWCADDCDARHPGKEKQLVKNGLYVGVLSGGVHVQNRKTSIDIDRNQYTFVAGAEEKPVRLKTPPAFLMFETVPALDDDNQARNKGDRGRRGHHDDGRDEGEEHAAEQGLAHGHGHDNTDVVSDPLPTFNTAPLAEYRAFGFVFGGMLAADQAHAVTVLDGVEVRGFAATSAAGPQIVYDANSAQTLDLGYDAVTGLSWGRWANGSIAMVNLVDGSVSYLDLGSDSVHWISGPVEAAAVTLPTTGTANYTLIGNTSPTDNLGHTGVLGSASLSADFTNQTVDAQVNVGINNQVWNGSATGMAIGNGATFGGAMDVQTQNVATGAGSGGQGAMVGTFVGPATASGAPAGAGTAYSMTATPDGVATTVTGVAAYEAQQ